MFLTIDLTRLGLVWVVCSECSPRGSIHCDAEGTAESCDRFEAETLTHSGGVYLFHRFFSRIGFKNAMAMEVRLVQRNHRYSVGEMLLALLYPMILGLERIESDASGCGQNGVFQYLTGLPHLFRSVYAAAILAAGGTNDAAPVRRLHDRLLSRMTGRPYRSTAADLRCRLDGLRGLRQDKRGHRSATTRSSATDPRITRCAVSRGGPRTSGTASCGPAMPLPPGGPSTGSRRISRRGQRGSGWRLARADKGVLRPYVDRVARGAAALASGSSRGVTAPIKRKLAHLRYTSPVAGSRVAEFRDQPTRWPHPSRFIVVRRPQPKDPTSSGHC